jgi:hypothetical protein
VFANGLGLTLGFSTALFVVAVALAPFEFKEFDFFAERMNERKTTA